jgi:hypothetical protein
MHETLVENVKGYIDKKTNGRIVGWAFHMEYGSLPLRMKKDADSVALSLFLREDVILFYKSIHLVNHFFGFDYQDGETNVDKTVDSYELQMYIENEWKTIIIVPNFAPKIRKNNVPGFTVIDNVYEDPDAVRNFALQQHFELHPEAHKGKRTDQTFPFLGLKELFEEKLGVKIKNWEKYGTNCCFQYCIAGDQLVYHYDSQEYAGVLFLTPDAPPQTGTTFHRSKHTKKMKIDEEEKEKGIVFKQGFLDSTEFDVVDVVGNVYNRLVLFNAKYIHSASCYFGTDKNNGRLFQLFFFDLEEP